MYKKVHTLANCPHMESRNRDYDTATRQAVMENPFKCRGWHDQMFAIRQILEQCSELNRTILFVFIEFRAAFDKVNRDRI